MEETTMYDILIIGGGPAGITAAIYARRQGKSVLMVEKNGFGGQISYAPRVENYPGVPSIEGAALAELMLTQALDLETEVEIGTVNALSKEGDVFTVGTEEGDSFTARSVILAAGARHRQLNLPEENDLLGRGVSYCAVCDGSFYAGKDVAVVGGGDSALQETLLLSEICRKVYLVHRREEFRGDAEKQSRLRRKDNVEFMTPYEIWELLSDDTGLTGLSLRNTLTGANRSLDADALFVSIGTEPELGAFSALVPLTRKGYADVSEGGESPTPGLFVAGDCRAKAVRQLTTAVSDGANAALAACRFLG